MSALVVILEAWELPEEFGAAGWQSEADHAFSFAGGFGELLVGEAFKERFIDVKGCHNPVWVTSCLACK